MERGRLYKFFIGEQSSPEARETVRKQREERRADREQIYQQVYQRNAQRRPGNWLQRLLTPHGRAPRRTYLLVMASWLAVWIFSYVLILAVALLPDIPILGYAVLVGTLAGLVGLCIVTLMVSIRRLHDMDATGLWLLFSVSLIGALVLWVVLMVVPGTDGPNRYGHQ